ncbi:hypothetical protein PFICI_03716 [Pestalotiopsis fici W106-1]|uniref:Uncharacterized protein n=1 Tax=Pestalotiopsis fici (strain W106-1 / CGMCC3.15140) TaxID=1229662 RepID=W3XKD0_PESFW|nr:uncharacterized protein PFICI_03716 [Pestalotiopsis fici W106-1]ETS85691.1 hypothetical protein PFICI_03716 [Pestalotiopsis fici W106-1]
MASHNLPVQPRSQARPNPYPPRGMTLLPRDPIRVATRDPDPDSGEDFTLLSRDSGSPDLMSGAIPDRTTNGIPSHTENSSPVPMQTNDSVRTGIDDSVTEENDENDDDDDDDGTLPEDFSFWHVCIRCILVMNADYTPSSARPLWPKCCFGDDYFPTICKACLRTGSRCELPPRGLERETTILMNIIGWARKEIFDSHQRLIPPVACRDIANEVHKLSRVYEGVLMEHCLQHSLLVYKLADGRGPSGSRDTILHGYEKYMDSCRKAAARDFQPLNPGADYQTMRQHQARIMGGLKYGDKGYMPWRTCLSNLFRDIRKVLIQSNGDED